MTFRGVTLFLVLELVATSCMAPLPATDAGVEASDAGADASDAGADAGACRPGQTLCSGRCTDLNFDYENCGRCGVTCPIYVSSCVSGQCFEPYPCSSPCSAKSDACRQWRVMCHGEYPATCEPTSEVMPAGTACDGGVRCDAGVCVE